jgi:hypothetical protein
MSLVFILWALDILLQCLREPESPVADRLCDAMAATAFTFLPPLGNVPVKQRPDDKDRIMDRYTCLSEPLMLDFVSSVESRVQNLYNTWVHSVQKCCPPFPPQFRIWDTTPGHNLTAVSSAYNLCHQPKYHSHIYQKECLGKMKRRFCGCGSRSSSPSQCTTRAHIQSILKLLSNNLNLTINNCNEYDCYNLHDKLVCLF